MTMSTSGSLRLKCYGGPGNSVMVEQRFENLFRFCSPRSYGLRSLVLRDVI